MKSDKKIIEEIDSLITDTTSKDQDIFNLDKPSLGEPVVIFKNVKKTYKLPGVSEEVRALNGVTMDESDEFYPVKKGEFVMIRGPSGGGKTTLLNIIGTLDSDFNVSISYQDPEDIPSQYSGRRPVSMDYLLVGVYTEGGWIQYGSSYYTQIGNIVPNADGEYPIISDSIAAPTGSNTKVSKTYYVYIWLREDTPATEIGKLAYLKLNVKSIASDQS